MFPRRPGSPHLSTHFPYETLQSFLQCIAAANQAGLYRSQRNLQHLCNLLIGEPFNIAQYYGCTIRLGDLFQFHFHSFAHFFVGQHLHWRFAFVRQGVAQTKSIPIFIRMRFHGCLFALVPEPPAPLVGSLMDRDAVEPRLQAAFAVEALHAAKYFEKNFLGGVRRIRGVSEDAVYKAVNRLVIVGHKPVVSLFRARFQLRHNRGFFGPYAARAGYVSQCCYSRHFSHGVTPIFSRYGRRYNCNAVTAVTNPRDTAILHIDRTHWRLTSSRNLGFSEG